MRMPIMRDWKKVQVDFLLRITAILGFLLLVVTGSPLAGKNSRGALVVHTDDNVVWTVLDTDYCDDYAYTGLCDGLNTQSNIDGNFDAGIIWLQAAFPQDANPGVTVVYLGLRHNFTPGFIAAYGFCGPAGTLEIPDSGWPNDWENAGNSIAFGSPIVGQTLFPFYWLAAYGLGGDYLGTGINPTGGYAGFVSNDSPPILDEIFWFGEVHWFEPGYNECPLPPEPGACCLLTGECLDVLLEECEGLGGDFFGDGTVCEPGLCLLSPGACCFYDGHCEIFHGLDCEHFAGAWQGPDTVCDPNPCPPPTQACCFEDGTCMDLSAQGCEDAGGSPMGAGTNCGVVSCRPQALGACCFSDISCQIIGTEEDCSAIGGDTWYDGEACEPNPCFEAPAVEETTWGQIKSGYR
jgi:hypothetical protein